MTGKLSISKQKNMEKHQRIYFSSKQSFRIMLEKILINSIEINATRT